MKKTLLLLVTLALMITLTACGGGGEEQQAAGNAGAGSDDPTQGEEITIKIATVTSETAPACMALFELEKNLEEVTAGRIQVEVFPSGQLGSEAEVVDQTRRGDIQMCTNNPLNFTTAIPELSVMNLYFLFDDLDHAFRAMDAEAGDMLLGAYDAMNLDGMAAFALGFSGMANSKNPIETVEDLQGLKIRGFNPVQIAAWEALGCNLSSVAWNELFTALQQNLIDGGQQSLTSLYEGKFYEVQPYFSATNHQFSTDVLVASQIFMESLTVSDQELIKAAVDEAVEFQRTTTVELTNELIDTLPTEYNCAVNEVSLEERAKMNDITSPVIAPTVIEACGQEFYDQFIAAVEAVRE